MVWLLEDRGIGYLFRCFVGCHRPEHSPWLKAPWHRASQIWAVSPGTAEAGNFVDVQFIH